MSPVSTACSTTIPASDTTALIAAIITGNGAGVPYTICLTNSTYTLNAVDNTTDGANGLPSIVGNVTIVGNGASITRDGAAPAFRLFQVAAGGSLALENVTLTNGSLPDPLLDGGAVFNRGTLALDSVALSGHQAGNDGGAVFNAGSLTITGSTLTGNQAGDDGGALNTENAAATISTSTFANNTAEGDGGAVEAVGGILAISGSTFNANHATEDGGAIRLGDNATLDLTASTLSNNTSDVKGGALSAELAASITISNTAFQTNTALSYGGAIHAHETDLSITGSSLTGNTAGTLHAGGAISTGGSSPHTTLIRSSTLGSNSAYLGGGLYYDNPNGTALIDGQTLITTNSAAYRGGGVYVASGTLTLDQATLTANTTSSSSGAGVLNLANLIVQNGTIIADNVSASSGGGIWNSGTLTLSDSTLTGNQTDPVSGRGGGLYSITNSAAVSGGEFTGNQALDGAAVYVAGGTLNLSSHLHDNSAGDDGGGAYIIAGGTLVADYATFATNSAVDDGGAISNKGALTITNSQLLTNSANDGGALHTEVAGSNVLNSSCISGNTALADTEGVRSTVATFNATGNWWGAADGPSGAGTGSGDEVNANVDYAGYLISGCPAGSGAAGTSSQTQSLIASLSQEGLSLFQTDALALSSAQTPATLPYAPSLEDETVWRVRGAWDLAAVDSRAGLGWSVDAAPRSQTSILELAVPLDLGRRNSPAQLGFNQRIWLAGTDTFTVEVLPQGESEWLVMDTQSTSDTGWQPHTVDLGQFRGQTVRLRFRLQTGDEQDVISVGVWLDGISLTSQR